LTDRKFDSKIAAMRALLLGGRSGSTMVENVNQTKVFRGATIVVERQKFFQSSS
jgi:hypothetical protein